MAGVDNSFQKGAITFRQLYALFEPTVVLGLGCFEGGQSTHYFKTIQVESEFDLNFESI